MDKSSSSTHVKAALTLVATIFVAALVLVLAKTSLERVDPVTFNWLQIAACLVFLSVYTFGWRRESWPSHLNWQQWLYPIAIGLANFTCVRYLFIASLELLPVTTHAYLVNFTGLFTMLLSIIVVSERPQWQQWVGALIAISGITVFFEEIPPPEEVKGLVLLAVGVFLLALTNNLIRRFMIKHGSQLSASMLSTIAIWPGGLPIIIYGLLRDSFWSSSGTLSFSITDWLIIVANGVLGLGVTLIVFNHVMKVLRSYEASILASTGLVFVAVLAIPIAGEVMTINNIIGAAILFVGIFISQIKKKI